MSLRGAVVVESLTVGSKPSCAAQTKKATVTTYVREHSRLHSRSLVCAEVQQDTLHDQRAPTKARPLVPLDGSKAPFDESSDSPVDQIDWFSGNVC